MQELGGLLGDNGGPTYRQQGNGGLQSYNHKEQDSAHHLNDARNGFFPEPPHRSPASQHLDFLYSPEQGNRSSQPGLLARRTVR